MLKHNCVDIPEEGLQMIRLAPFYDWHTNNLYSNLANEDDQALRPLVADFADLIRRSKNECFGAEELTDEECDALWNEHYADIANKYAASGNLRW